MDAPPDHIAIRPAEGCRLILPDGGIGLDGLAIAPGADLPTEGGYVQAGIWTRKRLDEGDALDVTAKALAEGARRARERDGSVEPQPAARPPRSRDGATETGA